MSIKNQALFIFLLWMGVFALPALTTEFSPWFGPVLVVEGRATAWLENYSSIDGKHTIQSDSTFSAEHIKRIQRANNGFLDLSASMAIFEDISFEVEALGAVTRHRSFGPDSILLTGRYRFMNDIVGEPVSLSAGLTLMNVFKSSRHDLGIIHHGSVAAEVHAAVGKELSCQQFWTSRCWAVGAVGLGDIGSPWLRGDFVWEHNWWDLNQLRLFTHTLWGLGHNRLNLTVPFKGYGPIQHQSVDVGIRYSRFFESGLTVHLEYAYRAYARNCPEGVNFVAIGLLYPFNL